ncbi:3'-5' exonuclease [Defluviitalea phaphyphila]|uniref:3'-5' exonuclease n=1 Tax=Defluviitalea phaphyphila TaxID=1473580 RepID=UPI000730763B|nr:3'-5' exonuclease [Defluviitalea phaphyphila]
MKENNIKNLVVFDLETTGCNPVSDHIIEIGAIKIKDGKISSKYHQMVNPNVPIPNFITEITGITNDMVQEYPSIEKVLPEFLSFCDTDYILGHNISFDYRFIKAKCVKLGYSFNKKAFDTLSIAKKFLSNLPSRSLGALCQHYGIDLKNAHRAIHDAEATYKLFKYLKRDFYDLDQSAFKAKNMAWKPPKQEMITQKQKKYLLSLIRMYKIELDKDIDTLTKSEASRLIDRILTERKSKYI